MSIYQLKQQAILYIISHLQQIPHLVGKRRSIGKDGTARQKNSGSLSFVNKAFRCRHLSTCWEYDTIIYLTSKAHVIIQSQNMQWVGQLSHLCLASPKGVEVGILLIAPRSLFNCPAVNNWFQIGMAQSDILHNKN